MRQRPEKRKAVQDANLVQPMNADGIPAFNFQASLYLSHYFHATEKFNPIRYKESVIGKLNIWTI